VGVSSCRWTITSNQLRQGAAGHVRGGAAIRQASGLDGSPQPVADRRRGGRPQVQGELVDADLAEWSLEPVRCGLRQGDRPFGSEAHRAVVEGEADRPVPLAVPAAQVRPRGGVAPIRVGRHDDAQPRGVGGVRAGRPIGDLVTAVVAPPPQVLGRVGVPVHKARAVRRLGQAVVLVERHDLAGVVQRQRVGAVRGPVGQPADQRMDLAGMADVRPLVRHAQVPLDVLENVGGGGPDDPQVAAQLGKSPRSGPGDVGVDGVIGQRPQEVVLDTDELDLVGAAGVELAQPAQHVRHLTRLPLWAHLTHERVQVPLAGAEVLVDPQPRRPVLLPGDGAKSHPLDKQAQGPLLEGLLLGRPVNRLAQPDDGRIADRAAKGGQVVELGGGVDAVEWDRAVPDPAGHRLGPGVSRHAGCDGEHHHDRGGRNEQSRHLSPAPVASGHRCLPPAFAAVTIADPFRACVPPRATHAVRRSA
jgi:hypothetical protein